MLQEKRWVTLRSTHPTLARFTARIDKYIMLFKAILALAILQIFISIPLSAQPKAVSITATSSGTTFILDNMGHVWGFAYPDSASGILPLPTLNDIKEIVPFGALRKDGKVLVWGIDATRSTWRYDSDGNPLGRSVTYTTPKIVDGIDNVIYLAGMDFHYVALLKDGTVVQWGRPLNNPPPAYDLDSPTSIINPNLHVLVKLDGIESVYVGTDSEVILTNNGDVYGWGDVFLNECPQPNVSLKSTYPEVINIGRKFKKIYENHNYLIALADDGYAHYWGGCSGLHPSYLHDWKDDIGGIIGVVPSVELGSLPNVYILKDHSIVLTAPPAYQCDPFGCMLHPGIHSSDQLRDYFGRPEGVIDANFANTFGARERILIRDDGTILVYDDGTPLANGKILKLPSLNQK